MTRTNDGTNPGGLPKAPIERLLQMMDVALSEQARAADIRAQALEGSLQQINKELKEQGAKFNELRARFDSVDGRVGIDERLRSIESTLQNVATKSDVAELERQLDDIDGRVTEIEGIEERRLKSKEDLGNEVRSAAVKWLVPLLLTALVIGIVALIWLQLRQLSS